jgi:hypothetical protein
MREEKFSYDLLNGYLGKAIAENYEFWQMTFGDEAKLASFAQERGVEFWEDDIRKLWKLKLIRADLVSCPHKLRYSGLIYVGKDDYTGEFLYADNRRPMRRAKGWKNAIISFPKFQSDIKLFFHPFRYYVLYELQRQMNLPIHPMQIMTSEQYPRMLIREIEEANEWTSSREFIEIINHWNDTVAICVLLEPCFYERIFHQFKYPHSIGYDLQKEKINQHWLLISQFIQHLGVETIDKIRTDLCISAEMLDPNKNVHVMLRLSNSNFRQEIEGDLGGSITLLTMAEILRLSAERALNITLREEDEMGFGFMPQSIKQSIYGSERLLDNNRSAANQFLRSLGLDYTVRLH